MTGWMFVLAILCCGCLKSSGFRSACIGMGFLLLLPMAVGVNPWILLMMLAMFVILMQAIVALKHEAEG